MTISELFVLIFDNNIVEFFIHGFMRITLQFCRDILSWKRNPRSRSIVSCTRRRTKEKKQIERNVQYRFFSVSVRRSNVYENRYRTPNPIFTRDISLCCGGGSMFFILNLPIRLYTPSASVSISVIQYEIALAGTGWHVQCCRGRRFRFSLDATRCSERKSAATSSASRAVCRAQAFPDTHGAAPEW